MKYPLIPIRNAVIYPTISIPLIIGRPKSLVALEAAVRGDSMVVIVAQSVICADPGPQDLYKVGTLAKIDHYTETGTGSTQVVLTGVSRFRITDIQGGEGLSCLGVVEGTTPSRTASEDLESLKEIGVRLLSSVPGATEPLVRLLSRVDDLEYLTHVYAAYLNLPLPLKQMLLAERSLEVRADRLNAYLSRDWARVMAEGRAGI